MQLPRKNLTVPAGARIWCQGIGQALLEHVAYDPASGQLLNGSFMDFAMPRADDLPTFTTACNPVIGDDNPLGVKSIREGLTTGSPPAVVNAVLDALSGHGVHAIEMPAHARARVAGAGRTRKAPPSSGCLGTRLAPRHCVGSS
jgi:hypothetical protein